MTSPSLPAARAAHDHATLALWASQSELLAACESGDAAAVEQWRAVVAADSRMLSLAADLRTAAFDAVASERSAASPVRLAARELTPDDAWVLSRADDVLSLSRRILDRSVASDHALQSGLLRAIECGDLGAAEDCREALRVGYALTAAHRFAVEGALAARAPLLAARWQEVAP